MNKLTKVGFSALCGSLAAISAANAGDITVTGGVDMTWVSHDGDTTGNPIGIGSNLTFKGSGELDNGWTFDYTVANTNANAYSATNLGLTMGGLGELNINQGNSGNGIAAYDDKMPTAWEEAWGAGVSTGVKTVLGIGASNNIQYKSPKVLGTTIVLAYSPEVGTADTSDKATTQGTDGLGKGYDAVIDINPSFGTELLSGFSIYAGGHYSEHHGNNKTYQQDVYEGVAGVTLDLGPISLGYASSGFALGTNKKNAAGVGAYEYYKSAMYGVAFNVNDDLSVSYGFHEQRKEGLFHPAATAVKESLRKVEVESWQIAYTVGGASIRVADTKSTNAKYAAGNNVDATTVSLGLAF